MSEPITGDEELGDRSLPAQALASGPARVRVEFHDYTLHVGDSVFYAVGRERGQFNTVGGSLDLRIRTTRIFRWAGGRWRQVHHHGAIDDPVLLERYQRAVR